EVDAVLQLFGQPRDVAGQLRRQGEGAREFPQRVLEAAVAEHRSREAARSLTDRSTSEVQLLADLLESGEHAVAGAADEQLLGVELQEGEAHPGGAEMHLRAVVEVPFEGAPLERRHVVALHAHVPERIDLCGESTLLIAQEGDAESGPAVR